jgi:uncharacterized protein YbjT (DUF2867 family)
VSSRRLLVTGASGYLGGAVVRLAKATGWDALGTSFRAPGDMRVDVRDPGAVRDLVMSVRPDCIVHTAYVQDGPEAWGTNVDGAANVARLASVAGARLWSAATDLDAVTAAAVAVAGRLVETIAAAENRRLVLLGKTGETPQRFPRRPGMASKRPLVRVPSRA